MGGNSASTPETGPSPVLPQGISPVMMQSLSGGPPKVDPLSYSDPNNMPDPLIELLKGIAGMAGYGPPTPKPKGK